MRIGLLTEWFDPEPTPLPGALARGLARRGHEVRVLTGFPNYPTGRLMAGYSMSRRQDEVLDGVQVRRVALYPSHDTSPVRRGTTYTSFALSALASGVDTFRGLDAIWVTNSPITSAIPMWFVRYAYRVPVVLHVLDLWPDTVAASGLIRSGAVLRTLEHAMATWCSAMYKSAARIAYISPGVGDLLSQRGVPLEKLAYIPMWADEARLELTQPDMRAELGIRDDQTVLVYAGAIGEAQGLDHLVDACATVDDPRFACVIAGSGVSEASLRQRATEMRVANVRFLGRLPVEKMPALMRTGDVHFVSLRPGGMSPFTMPSKVQAILASSRAMLVAGEGDLALVAKESGAGITVHPGEANSIAEGIREIRRLGRNELDALGRLGRRYYEQTFSVESGVDRVEQALRHAMMTRKPK